MRKRAVVMMLAILVQIGAAFLLGRMLGYDAGMRKGRVLGLVDGIALCVDSAETGYQKSNTDLTPLEQRDMYMIWCRWFPGDCA